LNHQILFFKYLFYFTHSIQLFCLTGSQCRSYLPCINNIIGNSGYKVVVSNYLYPGPAANSAVHRSSP